MIMAEKIIDLRKRNGWTQEGLAARLGVSRQAISKWESAQSVPDLKNILELAQLFEVSTDYLMRDELAPEDEGLRNPLVPEGGAEDGAVLSDDGFSQTPALRQVSMEEASQFLTLKQRSAQPIALGVATCIVAAAPLITMIGLQEAGIWKVREAVPMAVGIPLLLILVAIAVSIFLTQDFKLSEFKYLKEQPFETAYGVTGMVKQQQNEMRSSRTLKIIFGVALCIIAPSIVVTGGLAIGNPEHGLVNGLVAAMLIMIAFAVYLFVSTGIAWGATMQLLQEGDYEPINRAVQKQFEPYAGAYWTLAVAIFLGYSLPTNDWQHSWVIWPVAGMLFGVYYIVLERVLRSRIENSRS